MPRKRVLIPSPLAWTPAWNKIAGPVPHPPLPVVPERGGTQIRTPKPTVIVDTREQNPLSFRRFRGWFARIEYSGLPLGDYSVRGMENSCVVERKDLADLIQSFTTNRAVFVKRLQRMSSLTHSLLVVTASLGEIKTEYPYRAANPNRITHSLIAVLAGLRLPFLCVDTHELAEEIVASYLYQTFLYDWLDRNGHGRYLADGDL
jgi:ERCC4-type nuclease